MPLSRLKETTVPGGQVKVGGWTVGKTGNKAIASIKIQIVNSIIEVNSGKGEWGF